MSNKVTEEFNASQLFQGFDMHFLRFPKTYKFTEVVSLQKTKFNYHLKNICKRDTHLINSILGGLHPELKIFDCYINGKKTLFRDNKGTMINFADDKEWLLTITIQGYKISEKGIYTPVWKIDEAVSV